MKPSTIEWFWLPRILCIIFIIGGFISIIDTALDANEQGANIINTIGFDLSVKIIMLILLIIAWKRELLGGVLIIILGFIIFINILLTSNPATQNINPATTTAFISALMSIEPAGTLIPYVLLGALFISSYYWKKKNNSGQQVLAK